MARQQLHLEEVSQPGTQLLRHVVGQLVSRAPLAMLRQAIPCSQNDIRIEANRTAAIATSPS